MASSLKVLVVDDSAFMRRMIAILLEADKQLSVVGFAKDGHEAVEHAAALKPDVITLDVEMPGMDGWAALEAIMASRPTPVVMLSSLTQAGAETTIKCLHLGAVDFVGKPSGSISLDVEKTAGEWIAKVRAAACAPKRRFGAPATPRSAVVKSQRAECVFIGTSTGGPRALQAVLTSLPGDLGVPIVVVQHMPAGFTRALASRLDSQSLLKIREAKTYDRLEANTVLIAPGGFQMQVGASGVVRIVDTPPVNSVKPSADVTLFSLADLYGASLMGILLTGMGRDGAD